MYTGDNAIISRFYEYKFSEYRIIFIIHKSCLCLFKSSVENLHRRAAHRKFLKYIEHFAASASPMKIKVINIWENPTAIYLYSRKLASVDNRNISVLDMYQQIPGSNRIKREMQMGLDSYFQGLFLRYKLKSDGYDILHYTDPMIPPVKTHKTSVVTVHDNPAILLNSDLYFSNTFNNRLTKKFLKRNIDRYIDFKNILTNSNYVRKSLLEYGFTGNIETIHLSIDPYFKKLQERDKIRNELGLPDSKTLLLSVSTNVKRKNLNIIEKAMKLLPDNFALVRVGESIGKSITFQNVSKEKLNKIYNACDVLLMSSIEEGLGLPLIEGFATGIPVVASDIEVFHEIGKDAVEYIDPMNVQPLIDGINTAVQNRDKMIYRGDKIVPEFSFEIFKDKMLNYYKKIL